MKLLIASIFFLYSGYTYAQTSDSARVSDYARVLEMENIYVEVFEHAMEDIKGKILSDGNLTGKQKRILLNTKELLQPSIANSFNINSDSEAHTIVFNENAWRSVFRYLIAIEISKTMHDRVIESGFNLDESDVDYNRNKYIEFYNDFLRWLFVDINIIQQAELNDAQRASLLSNIDTSELNWEVKKIVLFIYLHEFYHQVQNINKLRSSIQQEYKNPEIISKKLLGLEIQCDSFALYKSVELRILPENFLYVYGLINSFKHNKRTTSFEIMERKLEFFKMLYRASNTINEPYLLNFSLSSIQSRISTLENQVKLDREATGFSVNAIKNEAEKENNIQKYYSLAMLYLKGNSYVDVKNINDALIYFEKAGLVTTNSDSNSLIIQEKALLYSGKIHELIKHNNIKASYYYSKASEISLFFPSEYYMNILNESKK